MKTILSLRCTKKWYSMKKILYQAAYSIYWWRDEKLPRVERKRKIKWHEL